MRSMSIRLRRVLVLCCFTLIPISAAAQALLPAVSFRTLPGATREQWPADFNEDGITDLAVAGPQFLEIRLGNGDGTFRSGFITNVHAYPLATGDLNNDGNVDVIADLRSGNGGLIVLPGTGTGSLGAARLINSGIGHVFALVADLDKDGARDVAAGRGNESPLLILAGNGDLTFDAGIIVATASEGARAGIIADVNEDTWPDLVVSFNVGGTLLLLNDDDFAFDVRAVPQGPGQESDVTARDLNADGNLDLAMTGRSGDGFDRPWDDGYVLVTFGNGTGGFGAGTLYPTGRGANSIVVGDFTHDGVTDIATTNLSWTLAENSACYETFRQNANSLSILPGTASGTFGLPVSFALDAQTGDSTAPYDLNGLTGAGALNTSDINRDGYPDLLVGRERLLVTTAPRANRTPTAVAGPDRTSAFAEIELRGTGTDPDGHFLEFAWSGGAGGAFFGTDGPGTCYQADEEGAHTFTLTVSDGHSGSDSDDVTVIWDAQAEAPLGGSHQDVGGVGAAGTSSFDSGTYTVEGAGADIWNRADEFHWTYWTRSGDFTIAGRVASIENVNRWTKAGLMIRETLSAGSRHASVFATPTTEKGVAFQRRRQTNGTSVSTSGPSIAPPVWLQLTRTGDRILASYRLSEEDDWIAIGTETLSGLSAVVHVGLAVSSHVDGVLATGRFDDVTLEETAPFVSADIGAVGHVGSTTYGEEGLTVEGSGADIWGTADAFRYYYRAWNGDGDVTIRVDSIENTHRWAKAGLMFRESLAPGSKHVMAIVSSGKGLAMQYRAATNGASADAALAPGTAPQWLRLSRTGNFFTALYSHDGETWETLGTTVVAMSAQLHVGVPVTSHNNATLATATFSGKPVLEYAGIEY